jgi:hypothetical protein
MLKEMDAHTWLEWKAYMDMAPELGPEHLSYAASIIATAVWNVQIAKAAGKRGGAKFRAPHEFVLRFGDMPDPRPRPTRKQTKAEFWGVIQAMVENMGYKPKGTA